MKTSLIALTIARLAGLDQSTASGSARPSRASEALALFFGALPFLATAAAYQLFRVIPRQGRIHVHVGDLYALEQRFFPVKTALGIRAVSEVLATHTHPTLDILCGVTYLSFLIEVIGLSVYFFFHARPKMLELSLGFLLVNLAGWVIWLVYPAAPPWYVDRYGLGPALLDTSSSPAGLERLDALLGVPISATFYAKSANVFGAMPSLHVGYATLAALTSWSVGGRLRVATSAFALGIAFSAVYLRHHYLLDVLAGAALSGAVWGALLRPQRGLVSGWLEAK